MVVKKKPSILPRKSKRKSIKPSGIVGVCWASANKRWSTYIFLDNELTNLGYYKNRFDAACARYSYELISGKAGYGKAKTSAYKYIKNNS